MVTGAGPGADLQRVMPDITVMVTGADLPAGPGAGPYQVLQDTALIGSVFVTREHVRHNKSGIAHRGRTGINHLRELPTKFNHFAAVGRLPCPAEPVNHRRTFGMRGAETSGRQPVVPRAAFINLEKQLIPRAALGAQNGGLSYETVC
jgi:hypothetical protein